MDRRILVVGGTGTLGAPVVRALAERGHAVRVLTRNAEQARRTLGTTAEVVEGAVEGEALRAALAGCNAVHVSLPTEAELAAVQRIVELARGEKVQRITYVSGSSVAEEHRWFEMVDVKMRAEELLHRSGIPYVIFCPTWVMETLHRFVREGRAVVISGRRNPAFHFFAADDFGRMVATAYEDDRALGRRMFVHGPEAITLPDALHALLEALYPDAKVVHLQLWQTRLLAWLTGQMDAPSRLLAYFDKVGEPGDPAEANALLGAPHVTLGEWIQRQKGVLAASV